MKFVQNDLEKISDKKDIAIKFIRVEKMLFQCTNVLLQISRFKIQNDIQEETKK